MVDFTKKAPGSRFHKSVILRRWFAPAAIINKGVSVRIMPVGDSITEGKYTQGGYRNPLLADRMMANRKMSASSCVC